METKSGIQVTTPTAQHESANWLRFIQIPCSKPSLIHFLYIFILFFVLAAL